MYLVSNMEVVIPDLVGYPVVRSKFYAKDLWCRHHRVGVVEAQP